MLVDNLRSEARNAALSGIREVMAYGQGRLDLIPLWAGESELVTPKFIRNAANQALADGETFYSSHYGIPDLREALARYHGRHFGRAFVADEFVVTAGGMHAIALAIQATAGSGDEILYLTPAWPNFAGAAAVAGVEPIDVPLIEQSAGWTCDVDRLAAAVSPRTKAIFVNTPSNPTGWTASHDQLRAILEIARRNGLWIIADEIYSRFKFDGKRAPSFYDVMDPSDRVIFCNTFSKNWAMTGWRAGWCGVHPSMAGTFANLVQYSTSGVAPFVQRGAAAALDHGDDFVADQITRARQSRDLVCEILARSEAIRFSVPEGAFYLFFSIRGLKDSRRAAFEMIDQAGVGVAPGSAFGEAGNGYLRICLLRNPEHLEQAAHRILEWAQARTALSSEC
jgi:aspartate/methionine/tyrosine aminotransferase